LAKSALPGLAAAIGEAGIEIGWHDRKKQRWSLAGFPLFEAVDRENLSKDASVGEVRS